MKDEYYVLDEKAISVVKALNNSEVGYGYNPWIIKGHHGAYIGKDDINEQRPKEWIEFIGTLEEISIPNADRDFIDWNVYEPIDYEKEIRAAFNIYSRKEVPPILYHYTGVAGLLGIISDQKIRATHISYLNDYSEFEYSMQLVKDRINCLADDIEAYKTIKSRFDLFEGEVRHLNVFLFSLTEDPDSLYQWQAYSGKGNGYCLGFKSNLIGLATPPTTRKGKFRLIPVLYDEKLQEKVIEEKINEALSNVSLDLEDYDSPGGLAHKFYKQLVQKCLNQMISFKSNNFKQEKEWRGFYIQSKHGITNPNRVEVKFRTSKDAIVPYVEIDINAEVGHDARKFPLRSITYGSVLDSHITEMSLKILLNENKILHGAKLNQSCITLR